MKKKLKTYERILELKDIIYNDTYLDQAINLHYKLISAEFLKKKLFYKYIFSNGRFIISTNVASVFYSRDDAFLSDVSQECLKTGIVSPNTVSSLLTLFKVSGRLSIIKSNKDLRKKKYVLTDKGTQDTLTLLNTMIPCLKNFQSGSEAPKYIETQHLRLFFTEYSKIQSSSIFLINLVKKSDIFISKDSGHMIFITIYMICACNKKDHTLSSIAKSCGVSRTHLKSIIDNAEHNDLLYFDQNQGKIHTNDSFVMLFKEYMSYYFAFVQYGLEGLRKI